MYSSFGIIFLALLAGSYGRLVPPEDEYTLQAIKELRRKASPRFLSELSEPKCTDKKKVDSIECCMSMKWMKQQRSICLEVGVNKERLQVQMALYFDGEMMIDHTLNVGEICAPLPGLLKKINICLHAYYVQVDTNPPKISFDSCFVVKLGGFFHFKLNCISLDKSGKFSHHVKYSPESKGILMLNLEEGNVKFNANNPIPKEVMDKIEQGWNIFEKDAGKLISGAGKEISGAAKDVEKQLDNAANQAKEAVVGEFNKVTAGIGALGGTIGGWFG